MADLLRDARIVFSLFVVLLLVCIPLSYVESNGHTAYAVANVPVGVIDQRSQDDCDLRCQISRIMDNISRFFDNYEPIEEVVKKPEVLVEQECVKDHFVKTVRVSGEDVNIPNELVQGEIGVAKLFDGEQVLEENELRYFSVSGNEKGLGLTINKDLKGGWDLSVCTGPVDSVLVFGSGEILEDGGYVRVIVIDEFGREWLVFGSDSLGLEGEFTVENICEETCNFGRRRVHDIVVEVRNATFGLESVYVLNGGKVHSEETYSDKQEDIRVDRWNRIISEKDLDWVAGETSVSGLLYREKKNLYIDNILSNTYGYEYYSGGVFETGLEPKTRSSEESVYPESWDWRDVHGENWMTGAKDQKNAGTCWAFSTVGLIEAYINLYFNQHVDADLSEQMVVDCQSTIVFYNDGPGKVGYRSLSEPYDGQITELDGYIDRTYDNDDRLYQEGGWHVSRYKIVDEGCDKYAQRENSGRTEKVDLGDGKTTKIWVDDENHACTEKRICSDWENRYWNISEYESYKFSSVGGESRLDDEGIKRLLITGGPISFAKYDDSGHAILLVGYETGDDGDIHWIYKNSWGDDWGDDGYGKTKEGAVSRYGGYESSGMVGGFVPVGVVSPPKDKSFWPDGFDGQIKCTDNDNDGFCNWGITKEMPDTCSDECSPIKDCNDGDSHLSIMYDYYNCVEPHFCYGGEINCDALDDNLREVIQLASHGEACVLKTDTFDCFDITQTQELTNVRHNATDLCINFGCEWLSDLDSVGDPKFSYVDGIKRNVMKVPIKELFSNANGPDVTINNYDVSDDILLYSDKNYKPNLKDQRWHLYLYNFSSGEEIEFTDGKLNERQPDISDGKAVWEVFCDGSKAQDMCGFNVYDFKDGSSKLFSNEDRYYTDEYSSYKDKHTLGNPIVSGDTVLYQSIFDWTDSISFVDIDTGEMVGDVGETHFERNILEKCGSFDGDGDLIVYSRFISTCNGEKEYEASCAKQVYLYNFSSGEKTKLHHDDRDVSKCPMISGDNVVWFSEDGIYKYDIKTKVKTKISSMKLTNNLNNNGADLHENTLVFSYKINGHIDVYKLDLVSGKVIQITDSSVRDRWPRISDDGKIFWVHEQLDDIDYQYPANVACGYGKCGFYYTTDYGVCGNGICETKYGDEDAGTCPIDCDLEHSGEINDPCSGNGIVIEKVSDSMKHFISNSNRCPSCEETGHFSYKVDGKTYCRYGYDDSYLVYSGSGFCIWDDIKECSDNEACTSDGCVVDHSIDGCYGGEVSCVGIEDVDTCQKFGCQWRGIDADCNFHSSCNVYMNEDDCGMNGCEWAGYNCREPPGMCDHPEKDACESDMMCDWSDAIPVCDGTVVCEEVEDGEVCSDLGCSWGGCYGGKIGKCERFGVDECPIYAGCKILGNYQDGKRVTYCSLDADCEKITDYDSCVKMECKVE
jgi:hypothetical protein